MIKYLFSLIVGIIIGYAFSDLGSDYEKNIVEEHQTAVKPIDDKLDTLIPKQIIAKANLTDSYNALEQWKKRSIDTIEKEVLVIDTISIIDSASFYYEAALTDCMEVVKVQDSMIYAYQTKDSISQASILALAKAPKKKRKTFIKHIGHGLIIIIGGIFIKKQIENL